MAHAQKKATELAADQAAEAAEPAETDIETGDQTEETGQHQTGQTAGAHEGDGNSKGGE